MKLTPLNIALAVVIAWFVTEWGNDQFEFAVWRFILFVVFLLVTDIVFRLLVKDMQKLWMGEIGFILVTGILAVLIRVM